MQNTPIKKDNPAGRLYSILEEARSKPGTQTYKQIWSEVFGIKSKSSTEFFHHFIQIHKLVDEVRNGLDKIGGINRDLYFKPFSNIEAVLSVTNFDILWNNVVQKLDEATMVHLAFCAEELSKVNQESPIDEKELSDLQKEIESLSNKALSSSLNEELKKIILEQLEIIRRAILEYRILGAISLRKALETGIGTIVLNQEMFGHFKKTEEVGKFTKILAKIDRIVSSALKMKELVAPMFNKMLGSGG